MGEKKEESEAISRRSYLKYVAGGAVAVAAAAGGYYAGSSAMPPTPTTSTSTVTETITAAPPATSGTVAAQSLAGETLHIQTWMSPEAEVIDKYVVSPFKQETGVNVVPEYGWTAASISKLLAQKENPVDDLFMLDSLGILTVAREGVLEVIDSSKIPNFAEVYPPFAVQAGGRGVGFYIYTHSILYNTDLMDAPTSWKVFWEKEWQGKIALSLPTWTQALFDIIMASIANGGTQYTPEIGFAKLKEIAGANMLRTESTDITAHLFATHDIALSTGAPADISTDLFGKFPIGVQNYAVEGVIGATGGICVAKGHKAKNEVIDAFINKALSREAQKGVCEELLMAPANKFVTLDPTGNAAKIAISADKYDSLITPDWDYLIANRSQWLDQYTKIPWGNAPSS